MNEPMTFYAVYAQVAFRWEVRSLSFTRPCASESEARALAARLNAALEPPPATAAEAVWNDILEARWHGLRVLGDMALDTGNEARGRGWHWLAENRRWPVPEGGGAAAWYYLGDWDDENAAGARRPENLPQVFESGWGSFPSEREALEAAAALVGAWLAAGGGG